MLIPHLHFNGGCMEAIHLYEKAFDTKAKRVEYINDDGGAKRVAHAQMKIHNQTVFLNDRFGNKDKTLDCAVHLVMTFKTTEELLACYEILIEGSQIVDPFRETPFTKMAGNFMDKFGVLWGFMVR